MGGVHHATSGNNSISSRSHPYYSDTYPVFHRIAERRGYQVSTLSYTQAWSLLDEIHRVTGEKIEVTYPGSSKEVGNEVHLYLVKKHAAICDSESSSQNQRRSFRIVEDIFRLIDKYIGETSAGTRRTSTGVEATSSHVESIRKKRRLSAAKVAALARGTSTGLAVSHPISGSVSASAPPTSKQTTDLSLSPVVIRKEVPQHFNASSTSTTKHHPPSSENQKQSAAPMRNGIVNGNTIISRGSTSEKLSSNENKTSGTTSNVVSTKPHSQDRSTNSSVNATTAHGSTSSNKTGVENDETHTTKNKTRSIAYLSAAAASTVAIAQSSTIDEDPLPLPRSKTSHSASTGSRNGSLPISAPPQYEKVSSNVIAQRELQLQQQKKGKDVALAKSIAALQQPRPTESQPSGASTVASMVNSTSSLDNPLSPKDASSKSGSTIVSATTLSQGSQAKETLPLVTQSATLPNKSQSTETVKIADSHFVRVKSPPHGSTNDISEDDNDAKDDSRDEKPTQSNQISNAQFPADTGKPNAYSGHVNPRPAVRVEFYTQFPSKRMMDKFAARFARWEPFWQVEKLLVGGLTVPVVKKEHLVASAKKSRPEPVLDTPNTVALFTITRIYQATQEFIKKAPTTTLGEPAEGECRLLVRMLPMVVSEYEKKKRSDTHSWPIGTYLQIRAQHGWYPQHLIQRKQQAHEFSKWLGICKPLDITSQIPKFRDSSVTSFALCCHSTEQYVFNVAICKYKSPQTIFKELMAPGNKDLKRLSIDAAYAKAKKMMMNNEVSLDDDDEDKDHTDSLKRISFSLKDPVLKTTIVTPVRGKKCRHFSVSSAGK